MSDDRHATLSSNRYDWQTPPWFLDLVREVGAIGFDPCTTSDNPTGARLFATQRIDSCGLLDEWPALPDDELAFVNPPYGPHLSGDVDPDYEHWRDGECVGVGREWARRIAQYDRGASLALVPVRTETVWWRDLFAASDLACLWSSRLYDSRINFVDATTGLEVRGSNLASCVFFCSFDPALVERFARTFGEHGTLVDEWRAP